MKPCILLIEDDSDMRELVAGHLEHGGFDVQRAEDGIKGQALALQYSPDLILLDLLMPPAQPDTGTGHMAACPMALRDLTPDQYQPPPGAWTPMESTWWRAAAPMASCTSGN